MYDWLHKFRLRGCRSVTRRRNRAVAVQAAAAFGGALTAALAIALASDPEFLGATLTVSLFVLPSVTVVAILERLNFRFAGMKDVAFLLSLTPIAGAAVVGIYIGGEAEDVWKLVGAWYLLEALVAYAVLLACSPGRLRRRRRFRTSKENSAGCAPRQVNG